MSNVSVLIYSCDKYADVWQPFFTLFFRYWDCPYDVYLATETVDCDLIGVQTLHGSGTWTERMRQAVEQIPTKYVIGMCEDMFFRRPVKQNIIDDCVAYMETNPIIGCFNFEKEAEPGCNLISSIYQSFGRKPSGNHFQKSCQPSLWRKDYLIKLLDCKMNPWQWEETETQYDLEHYVWCGSPDDLAFEYGYHDRKWFGIVRGRWIESDVQPLFEKEGIDIDLSIRGTV